jgi:PAS domain S-box-containing protein
MVIHSDLTDIKRHEKEVVDREARLAGLLSVTPDAIIAISEDMKIRVFNPGAEKLFGYNATDMIGQPLDLLMPARFQIAHADHIKRFLASPEQSRLMTERGEIIGVKVDGSEFLAEASVSKLQLDDEAILTVMLHDVTERKRAEADLIAAKEQAEHALIQAEKMAAIGTLTSGIGHEINNPLYAILGAAEAIRDGEDLSRCREHGHDIITYCKHIAEIIKNLSGYIHPAEKHGLEPVDVNETISEAISMARLSPQTQDIEIIERLHTVAEISARSEDVQQAFFNIIRNGLQAIGRKGTLEVDTGQERKFVSVRIRDTGAGIAPNDLAKIFDPFFTTKGPDEGEGIGLFVVQQIVKKYGGTIDFESELGKGTLCTIEFPVRGTSEGTV